MRLWKPTTKLQRPCWSDPTLHRARYGSPRVRMETWRKGSGLKDASWSGSAVDPPLTEAGLSWKSIQLTNPSAGGYAGSEDQTPGTGAGS